MAKRVNKKFLITVGIAIAVTAGTVLAVLMVVTRKDANELIAAAQILEKQGDREGYAKAREKYEEALRAKRTDDVDLILKLGEMSYQLTRYETDPSLALKDARGWWERGLQVNPSHVPTLHRMVELLIEYVKLTRDPGFYFAVRERTTELAKLVPDDNHIKSWQHMAQLGEWLGGRQTPDEKIDAAMAVLTEMLKKGEADPDAASILAQAYLLRARSRDAANDRAGGQALREQALAVFDEALKAKPDNPKLLVHQASFVLGVGTPSKVPPVGDEERQRSRDLLAKAKQVVDKNDEDYLLVRLSHIDALATQDLSAAEAEIQQLLSERPNELSVRVMAAGLWRYRPAKIKDAIALLKDPPPADFRTVGPRALLRQREEVQRLVTLADLQMSLFQAATPEEKAALKKEIDATAMAAEAAARNPEDPHILKLRGRTLLLEPDYQKRREAVTLLRRAMEKSPVWDGEVALRLAQTYIEINEAGAAKPYLADLLRRSPKHLAARKTLTALMLEEKLFDDPALKEHMAELEKLAPTDPDVQRFKLVMLSRNKDAGAAATKDIIASYPEGTTAEKFSKAAMYAQVGDTQGVERLLTPLHQEELAKGGNFLASRLLAEQLYRTQRRDEARKIVEAVLAKDPDNGRFAFMRLALSDQATPQQRQELEKKWLEEIDNPILRARQVWQWRMNEGKGEEALAALVEGDKAQPGNAPLMEEIFEMAITMRKYELAQQYAGRLTQMNQDQAGGLYYRAKMELAKGNREAAINAAVELTSKVGDYARHWLILAQAQQAQGQYQSAIGNYEKALARQFNNRDALIGIVDSHLALNNLAEAERYMDRGLELTNLKVFEDAKRAMKERYGDPATVTALREEDVKKNPGRLENHLALAENYHLVADSPKGKKDKLFAEANLNKAREVLEQASQTWPDNLVVAQQLAITLHRLNKGTEGLTLLDLFKNRPAWLDRPEPSVALAEYYTRLGRSFYSSAESAYREAIAKSKGDANYRELLTRFFNQTRQFDKLLKELTDEYARTKASDIQQELIELHINLGQPAEAEKLLLDAMAERKDDLLLVTMLARVKRQQGEFKAASEQLERVLGANPRFALALYERGKLKLDMQDAAGAIIDLTAARDLNPNHLNTRLDLADARLQRNESQAAVNELEAALASAPKQARLRLRLIDQYMSEQRWTEAERLINAAKNMPDLARDPTWALKEGQIWRSRGDLDKARASLETAFQMGGLEGEVTRELLEVMLAARDYKAIIELTDQMIGGQPGVYWWLHTSRALAFKGLQRPEMLMKEFERAMGAADNQRDDGASDIIADLMVENVGLKATLEQMSPRLDYRWQIASAQAYFKAQDFKNAGGIIDRLLGPDFAKLPLPQKARVVRMAGPVYILTGDYKKAISLYERHLENVERNRSPVTTRLEVLNNVASLYAENPVEPNPAKALVYSQRAFDLMKQTNMSDPHIVDTHAWVLVLTGKVDEGIDLLLRAAETDRSKLPAEVYYHLGEAYLMKSDGGRAASQLDEAKRQWKKLKAAGLPVDPALEPRIDKALEKAKQLPVKTAQP